MVFFVIFCYNLSHKKTDALAKSYYIGFFTSFSFAIMFSRPELSRQAVPLQLAHTRHPHVTWEIPLRAAVFLP